MGCSDAPVCAAWPRHERPVCLLCVDGCARLAKRDSHWLEVWCSRDTFFTTPLYPSSGEGALLHHSVQLNVYETQSS